MKSVLRINFSFAVLGYLLLLLSACNEDKSNEEGDQKIPANEILQTGTASWYGPGFDGLLTSNRERFDEDSLTAAHRTLPFDTIVEVVNTENDKSVEVRINDRGPYAQDRIIDLSKSAAEKIEMLDNGVAKVELFLVEAGDTIPENLNRPTYTIQVGEYNLEKYAEQFAESIGDGVRIEQRFIPDRDSPIFMIYYGNYKSIADAGENRKKLEERGFDGLVRQIN